MKALRGVWIAAGLEAVETREVPVTRTFVDFDDFWQISQKSPMLGPTLRGMASADVETLKSRLRALAGRLQGAHHVRCVRTCGERSPGEVAPSAGGWQERSGPARGHDESPLMTPTHPCTW